MYSDMSSRTMRFSSSNRNSASARAVSVFPTPVGPRKMNEPVGRFGSCRPARARRTALETAASASGCPTTRCPSSSSSFVSRSRSDSSILVTGMPVHFATISAMSSASTSSFRYFAFFWISASRFSLLGDLLLERRNPPVADLGRLLEVAAPRRLLGLHTQLLELAPSFPAVR